MSKIQFITGGAASGKTRWAITYYQACDNVLYLCINKELDKEIADRIAFNNKRNGIEWEIVKDVDDPAKYIDRNHKFTIFDGLGAYVSREMYAACPDPEEMTEELKEMADETISETNMEKGVLPTTNGIEGLSVQEIAEKYKRIDYRI